MRKSTLVKAILILVMLGSHAMAQGSGSSRVAPPSSSTPNRSNSTVPTSPRPPTVAQFAASFWKYLNNAKKPYRQWGTPGKAKRQGELLKPANSEDVAGQSDKFHHEVGQTFLNDIANQGLQRLPLGSILVREEYAADGQTLENLTVMYRAKAADPKHGNWYWLMYLPDGSLATTTTEQGNRPVAGRVQSCTQCHRQADGNDYVFLNDRPAPGASQAVTPGKAPKAPSVNPAGSGARR